MPGLLLYVTRNGLREVPRDGLAACLAARPDESPDASTPKNEGLTPTSEVASPQD